MKTIIVLASTYPRWKNDPEPQFIHELCKRLTKEFNVIALVPDSQSADPNGYFDNVEVIRYRYAPKPLQSLVNNGGIVANLKKFLWKWLLVPSFIFGQYFALKSILKQRKIDLIHAHWLIPQGIIAQNLAQKNNIPFIVTSHGGDLYGLKGKQLTQIKKYVAESASAMTVVSSAMTTYLNGQNISPQILQVIPMGIDLKTRFTPRDDLQRKTHELLFIGRLVEKKGIRFLLEALTILVKQYPKLTLKIIGFGPDEENLKLLTRKLNLEKHVDFLGAISQQQLPHFYQTASIFVAPFIQADNGDQEGLPVALMEAIGCACPIIAGQVAGIEDLLGDDYSEASVDPRNIKELANTIANVLENPLAAKERSQRIRVRTLSFIDWDNITSRYAELIKKCINQK
ncbi:glycosyltransferase [Acinetobacter thermotolerans]|uniref:glycosyltransferase n=1 Tax=Acinetobacter thermotolerans TaxID=3151487 RepID=UPI00325B2060